MASKGNISIIGAKSRRNNGSFFSIENAREIIQQKKDSIKVEDDEKILKKKIDMLSRKTDSAAPKKVTTASAADILGFTPKIINNSKQEDKSPSEIPAKYRKYYEILLKLRDDIKGISGSVDTKLGSTKKSNGTANNGKSSSFDTQSIIGLLPNKEEALLEIDEAIKRIYNGTYGICELTGCSIEESRLMAVPFTRYSIKGQEEKEKEKPVAESHGNSVFQADRSNEDLSDFELQDE